MSKGAKAPKSKSYLQMAPQFWSLNKVRFESRISFICASKAIYFASKIVCWFLSLCGFCPTVSFLVRWLVAFVGGGSHHMLWQVGARVSPPYLLPSFIPLSNVITNPPYVTNQHWPHDQNQINKQSPKFILWKSKNWTDVNFPCPKVNNWFKCEQLSSTIDCTLVGNGIAYIFQLQWQRVLVTSVQMVNSFSLFLNGSPQEITLNINAQKTINSGCSFVPPGYLIVEHKPWNGNNKLNIFQTKKNRSLKDILL